MAGEFKETESVGKYISSKFDYDLYNDEDNKKMPIVRIQRFFNKKTQDESWRFFENSKKTIEIFANSFDEKELNFIRSPNGILFCLKIYKQNKDADFIIKNIKDFSKE
mgnify:CR=1 FL=1